MEATTVEVIFPPRSLGDPLSDGLRWLTAELEKRIPDAETGFGLGGEHGYGVNFENDTFLMHRYCWCEREDCKWCSDDACGCPNPDPKHYVDGVEMNGDEAMKWSDALLGALPHDVAEYGTPEYDAYSKGWDARVNERDRRSTIVYPARLHTCAPHGLMTDRVEGDTWKPSQTAPNFWHKPTGYKVWWYKWIGRDNETHGDPGDLRQMLADCLKSVPNAA